MKTGERTKKNRIHSFGMRPEQEEAVNKTIAYFKSFKKRKQRQNSTLFMECQNAFWENLCQSSNSKKQIP